MSHFLTINFFQKLCARWTLEVLGPVNAIERSFRFIEEATEMVQATGLTKEEVLRVVDYVYSRPVGEPHQEAGGVMVTLVVLCDVLGIDLGTAANQEFRRIDTPEMRKKIHDKQAFKNAKGLVRND